MWKTAGYFVDEYKDIVKNWFCNRYDDDGNQNAIILLGDKDTSTPQIQQKAFNFKAGLLQIDDFVVDYITDLEEGSVIDPRNYRDKIVVSIYENTENIFNVNAFLKLHSKIKKNVVLICLLNQNEIPGDQSLPVGTFVYKSFVQSKKNKRTS